MIKIDNPYQTKQIIASLIMIGFTALLVSMFSIGLAILWLTSYLVWAIICAQMAKSRGRSLAGGIIGGYYLGLLSVIYYLIAGDTIELRVVKEQEARRKYS